LCERLRRAGVLARQVGVEQTMVNRIITTTKGAFSRRAIQIPETMTYLFEQLEALRTLETRTPRRDLLKFAPSGTGPEASQHDDAAIALGLCLVDDAIRDKLGRVTMDEQRDCNLGLNGIHAESVLWGGPHMPAGDRLCLRDCPGFVSTRRAHARHEARGGEPMDLRTFISSGRIAPNRYASGRRLRFRIQQRGMF
jgi:hypothetical protein